MKGILYVISTPLGNLKDITLRAIETLKNLTVIACEDTRTFQKLISVYALGKKRLISYYTANLVENSKKIIDILNSGEDVGLVCEAGTPGISDPGYFLIKSAIENDIKVVAIPGPSACISALVVSGLPTARFVYEGFLPRRNSRRTARLKNLAQDERTIIINESPHRILNTLSEILKIFGDINCALIREQTKLFEEIIRGRVSELIALLEKRNKIRGEITLVLAGKQKTKICRSEDDREKTL